ncbi:hypothetical protein EBT16_02795 [bacterium]|nr:hypothetical protein [bacterium]
MERGRSLGEVMGCVVARDGDVWTVDPSHPDYPSAKVGALSFICLPDCNSAEFACGPGLCCVENPATGGNDCVSCSSSSSGSSSSEESSSSSSSDAGCAFYNTYGQYVGCCGILYWKDAGFGSSQECKDWFNSSGQGCYDNWWCDDCCVPGDCASRPTPCN